MDLHGWIGRSLVALAATLVVTGVASGEPQGALLKGAVKDPSGLGMPEVKLTIVNTASGASRSALTDTSGQYRLPDLLAGTYKLTATRRGFAPFTQEVVLADGAERQVDIVLQIQPARESVTVVTRRSFLSDSVVGRRAVASPHALAGDTAQLLDEQPGVSLYGNGGVSSLPAIHGLADDRVRVTVNGTDFVSACANHMNPPLSYIDPSGVGSINVFAGITPVSVGGDSIGGTIAVDSPAPEFAAAGHGPLVDAQARTFYRNSGDGYGASFRIALAGESLSGAYNGSLSHADNYTASRDFKPAGPAAADRGWLPGNEVGSSRYEAQNHALRLALRHQDKLIEATLGVQHIPYQGFPNQRMDMTRNDSVHGTLRYVAQYGWGALETRLYADRTRHSMDFAADKQFVYGSAATFLAPGMPMETKGTNLGGRAKADISLSKGDILRVGLESQRYRLDDWWPPSPSVLPAGYTTGGMAPDTFENVNGGRRDRLGLFAEWDATWSPRWMSLLGIRGDRVMMNTGPVHGYNGTSMYDGPPLYPATTFNARDRRRTDDNLDLTALWRYTPSATLGLEAGYAMKTRSPNIYERYAWSTNTMAMEMVNLAGDGNFYIGNLDLKPEVAHTLSATASWHASDREESGVAITPYYTVIHDYVDVRRCPTTVCGSAAAVVASAAATSGFVYLQFVNQSAELYGVDVSGRSVLARSEGYGRFVATLTASVVRGRNRTTSDNLYHVMPANAVLALDHSLRGWTSSIEWQWVDGKTRLSHVRNEIGTGGYALFHLRSGYGWKSARVDVGVDNVLDKFYAPPLGGAYLGQGPTMSGTRIPWGVPIAGMGRSLYVSVTLRSRSE